jgi:endonuclease/exonuclease/phosphatase (EEP) superfamily protein YafD
MLLRRLFAALCVLIALVPIAVAALCLATPHRPLFYLIDIFTLPALSLAMVMTVGFLALRQPAAAGACAAAVAVFIAALMPQAFPAQPAAAPGAPKLRVVFANLYIYNPHPERLLAFIAREQPDIIATVESAQRAHLILIPSLEARYPYHYYWGETAVLSRFPITNPQHSPYEMSLVTTDIATPSGAVHLAVTHFDEPLPLRHNLQGVQAQYLDDNAALPGQRDTLVVGDFNSDFSAFRLQGIAHALGLHALGAPSGSWPTFLPSFFRIAIDNAMSGPAWHLGDRKVSGPFGSDHRAIAFTMTPAD